MAIPVDGVVASFNWDAQSWMAFLATWQGQAATAIIAGFFCMAAVEALNPLMMQIVQKRAWWPQACELQKDLSANFGYDRDQMTDEQALDSYTWILLVCSWHVVTGLMLFPVVIHGWDGAGSSGQLCFLFGTLFDLGFDLYDTGKKFLLTFVHSRFSSLGPPCPLQWFIVCCVMHHTLAMVLMVPMNLKYPFLPEYANIAASSLLAAGICFITGQYKFTLNCQTRGDFYQYKAIVVIQLVTVWVTRGLVWFYSAFNLLVKIFSLGDWTYLGLMCPLCVLFTLFNLVVLADATKAAAKWLPKSAPASVQESQAPAPKNKKV